MGMTAPNTTVEMNGMQTFARWAAVAAIVVALGTLGRAAPASAQPGSAPLIRMDYFSDANFPPRVSRPGRGFNLAATIAAQNRTGIARADTATQGGNRTLVGGQQVRSYNVLPYSVTAPTLTVPDTAIPGSVPRIMEADSYNAPATTVRAPVAVPAMPTR